MTTVQPIYQNNIQNKSNAEIDHVQQIKCEDDKIDFDCQNDNRNHMNENDNKVKMGVINKFRNNVKKTKNSDEESWNERDIQDEINDNKIQHD